MENSPPFASASPDIEDEDYRRAHLTTWLAGLLALAIAFATVVRPLISDHDPFFTIAGTINTALVGLCWWWFRKGRCRQLAPSILIGLTFLMAIPLILFSGGPSSQFTAVIPLFPMFATLIGGKRLAWITLIAWIVILPITFYLSDTLPDLTLENWNTEKSASRVFWLILSSTIAMVFALQFDQRSRELQQKLTYLAERDPLTGIGNRRLMDAAIAREIALSARHHRNLTVMLIDIDHFKRFNDHRGHAEGDLALQRIAQCLLANTRSGQDTVARYGGEEFAIILGETDQATAYKVAEKIRTSIQDLQLYYNLTSTDVLTATLGFTCMNGRFKRSADDLLRQADKALYHGKQSGRNCSVDAAHANPSQVL